MMAPSGKFWMAMPRDRASALAAVICALPARKQVGDQMIQGKQKQHAEPKSGKRREKGEPSQLLRLFDCRDQQAPDRCRHHHTGGKACK